MHIFNREMSKKKEEKEGADRIVCLALGISIVFFSN